MRRFAVTFGVLLTLAGILPLVLAVLLPDDWRAAQAAFDRGDYAAALAIYDRLAIEGHDPGRVAYHRAATLYQLNRFGEAATAYRQALEDASGSRAFMAWYGLGNALTELGQRQSGSAAVLTLEAAVAAYDRCLGLVGASPPDPTKSGELNTQYLVLSTERSDSKTQNLATNDCLANRQIAILLLEMKRRERQGSDAARNSGSGHGNRAAGASDGQSDDPSEHTRIGPEKGTNRAGSRYTPSDRDSQPGRGDLPLLLDDRNAPPVSADEAARHLDQALRRISGRGRSVAQPATSGRDW